MAGVAFAFSLWGNTYCQSIDFQVNELGKSLDFPALNMGLWAVRRKALYKYDPLFDDPFFAIGDACVSYPDGSNFDTKWNSAKALAITSWVVGGLVFCVILAMGCTPQLGRFAKPMGALLLVVTLFQGLTLLILNSEGCDSSKNPVFLEVPRLYLYYKDECTMGRGSKLNISSTVFWFVAAVLLMVMPPADTTAEDEIAAENAKADVEEPDAPVEDK